MSAAAMAGDHVVWVTAADRTADHAVNLRKFSAGVSAVPSAASNPFVVTGSRRHR